MSPCPFGGPTVLRVGGVMLLPPRFDLSRGRCVLRQRLLSPYVLFILGEPVSLGEEIWATIAAGHTVWTRTASPERKVTQGFGAPGYVYMCVGSPYPEMGLLQAQPWVSQWL